MNELTLHPNIYKTGASKGLISILERLWVRDHKAGAGTLYIISGFANYNGGVRFLWAIRGNAMDFCPTLNSMKLLAPGKQPHCIPSN